MAESAKVMHHGLLDLQVCTPTDWDDSEVVAFANAAYPCGTAGGWAIRREGNEALEGDPERQPCAKRNGYVHVMLDA